MSESSRSSIRFWVRLTPRGGTDHLEGVGPAGELRVRVRAAPVDGAANEALVRLLASRLGVATSSVTIERGVSARLKLVRVEGLWAADLRARWPGLKLGS